jgi:hypothetical protein
MRRGKHSHSLKQQFEVAWLPSEWQTERVRTGRSANQLQSRDARKTIVPHPMHTDRVYSEEESMWLEAVRSYQARTGRKFPTYCEILAIAKDLGYRYERFPD